MSELMRAELKAVAKENLRGRVPFLIVCWIIYVVLIGAVGWTGIGYLLLSGPLTLGIYGILLTIHRGGEVSYNNLFEGFRNFLSPFLAFLLTSIFTFLWTLLFIVPGIMAALRYSQTFYILKDNPGMDGNEAIQKSKAMMDGHKGELFTLWLSFIGWYLLCVITLGIACIWVVPYVSMSLAGYYDWLKKEAS